RRCSRKIPQGEEMKLRSEDGPNFSDLMRIARGDDEGGHSSKTTSIRAGTSHRNLEGKAIRILRVARVTGPEPAQFARHAAIRSHRQPAEERAAIVIQ